MVTHDYERGTIRGLPRAVLDELRRTDPWMPPGGIDKPTPAPWGPELWEEDHWGDDGWEF